jgi:DNA polymerase-3 subunit epsilon
MISLAFVDIETTGLSPAGDRIAEIGLIAVDNDRVVDRWTTMLRIPVRRSRACPATSAENSSAHPPSFADIGPALAERLAGRLLIAHNARFDFAFLRAEFERIGIGFNPQVLCSLMLSRKLYPHLPHHDLDSLVESHGLRVGTRHRALPDADLVWQWWQRVHRQFKRGVVGNLIESLLAGPVLPRQLDPSLIERLPESPGAYVFHGEGGLPLFAGAAGNLKLHVVNYFRVDHATQKALEYAHRITNITWRTTRGMLGAQLHARAFDDTCCATAKVGLGAYTWYFVPAAVPSIRVAPMSEREQPGMNESFGIFPSERKARNALVRLATVHRLCHCLLGICEFAKPACTACPVDQGVGKCLGTISRKKQLIRLLRALEPLRIAEWPHRGPVGIRERSDMHVVDHWQFLGTARTENEVHELLENRPRSFDRRLYRLLHRTLPRLSPGKIVDLSSFSNRADHHRAVCRNSSVFKPDSAASVGALTDPAPDCAESST